MEPVMKIVDAVDGRTKYIFNIKGLHDIHDVGKPDKPIAAIRFDANDENSHLQSFRVAGVTARDMKRSIQENFPDELGFLKLDYSDARYGPQARRYLNVTQVIAISPARFGKLVDGQRVLVGGARIQTKGEVIIVEGAPFALAAQVRRVLKRLDQDEEFCCEAPEPEAEEAESE